MKLYNNIEITGDFPPKDNITGDYSELPVPYLKNPPEIINISVGR